MQYLSLEKLGGDFRSLLYSVRGGRPTSAFSLAPGAKIHVAAELKSKVLFVTADSLQAKDVAKKFNRYFGREAAVYLPSRDDVLLYKKVGNRALYAERSFALAKILKGEAQVAVVSAETLEQYLPDREEFEKSVLTINVGDEITPQKIATILASGGYERVAELSGRGEFSVRGDTVEIYPQSGYPVRISFFDDIVENVKRFDFDTRERVAEETAVYLPPVADIIIRNPEKVAERLKKVKAGGHVAEIIADALQKLEQNPVDGSLCWLIPFMPDNLGTIFDYLDKDWTIVFDEAKLVSDKLKLVELEHKGRVKSLSEGEEALPEHINSLISADRVVRLTDGFKRLAFQQITSLNPLFAAQSIFKFNARPTTRYYLDYSGLITDLKNFNANGYTVVLCAGNKERAKSLAEKLKAEDVMAYPSDEVEKGIYATSFDVPNGFIYHDQKLVLVGADDLYGKPKAEDVFKPKKHLIAPKAGDYVVHEVHGIGICEGTVKQKVGDVEKDYVAIRYREGAMLYLPVDQMDRLTKYSGSDNPRLNKIGGKEFEKVKQKVRASVKKLAFSLNALYAERSKIKGFVYPPDTPEQKIFEDNFPFTPTADQEAAIKDVKDDMEKGKLMDRLICGDVGFGKTEVAFRAVFKAVMAGKQAAILAPTTILAKQHYNTLLSRIEGFDLKVDLLSRLQNKKQTDEILENVELGLTNVLVGTHRLLSKDVKFDDLGLLVLDEEQRFGVEHKEKLKLLKKDVDIITMSATPIPRTLSMSLNGIRDISLLETPPTGRLPVETYVTEYSDNLLKDAILREIGRGGQVLVLYNYVETIDSFASKVQNLAGGAAKIIVAHGQMSGPMLDERITRFYQREADVLVSTTIIENGIDLPDANTLFVVDADRFGLAQLYQLRGRVGRSGQLAHAYFTTRENKVVSEEAAKRLTSLMDYNEFGSGFKIALRDLELRGAGNLLGAEQHGHIAGVGYEMYTRLLREAVDEIRFGRTAESAEVEMKVDCNAYVGDGYVSASDRLRIYKKIAEIRNKEDKDRLLAGIRATYGEPPKPLVNLINVAYLKALVSGFSATRVTLSRKKAEIALSEDFFKNADLVEIVDKNKQTVRLVAEPPALLFNLPSVDVEDNLVRLIAFFERGLA